MRRSDRHEKSAWLVLIIVVIAFGAFILLVAAVEEPYHIDELRQTRQYDRSLSRVVEASRLQEQPPLDPVLNAIAQRVLGVGDVRQRALSVAFAVGSLLIVWRLTLRAGLSSPGSVTAIGVMAVTPLLIDVSAYARPYALPLFLMLTFLLFSDIWLVSGNLWVLPVIGVTAIALPWSRTVEPVIFLVLAVLASGVFALRDRWDRSRSMVLGGLGVLGLISGVFALRFVFAEVVDRTASGASSLSERVGRLFTEVPVVFAEAFPFWALVIVLGVSIIVLPQARRLIGSMWWWWVLFATGVGFAFAFSVVAPVGQPFYDRYLFTLVPPIAIAVGAAVSSSRVRSTEDGHDALGATVLALALLVVGSGVYSVWLDLTHTSRADWSQASQVLNQDLSDDTVVIYDAVTSLGSYRTPFAGYPRYTGDRPRPPLSLGIIGNPSVVTEGSNTAVLLLSGSDYDVNGWTPVSIDSYFTIFVPETPYVGRAGVAQAAEEFGRSLGPDLGSAMSLAAASIWLDIGESDRAVEIVGPLLDDSVLADKVWQAVESTELGELLSAGN